MVGIINVLLIRLQNRILTNTHVLGIKDNPPHGGINKINPEEYNIYSVDIYPDSLVFAVNHRHTYTYPRIAEPQSEGQFPLFINLTIY